MAQFLAQTMAYGHLAKNPSETGGSGIFDVSSASASKLGMDVALKEVSLHLGSSASLPERALE